MADSTVTVTAAGGGLAQPVMASFTASSTEASGGKNVNLPFNPSVVDVYVRTASNALTWHRRNFNAAGNFEVKCTVAAGSGTWASNTSAAAEINAYGTGVLSGDYVENGQGIDIEASALETDAIVDIIAWP